MDGCLVPFVLDLSTTIYIYIYIPHFISRGMSQRSYSLTTFFFACIDSFLTPGRVLALLRERPPSARGLRWFRQSSPAHGRTARPHRRRFQRQQQQQKQQRRGQQQRHRLRWAARKRGGDAGRKIRGVCRGSARAGECKRRDNVVQHSEDGLGCPWRGGELTFFIDV